VSDVPLDLIGHPVLEELERVVAEVAASHDHNCSPALRGQVRRALGLGECEERQDCPCRGGCDLCDPRALQDD
jgi:hypothetical protein